MRPDRRRTGAVLLEIMAGLLILAVGGIGWVTLMGQTVQSVHQIRLREIEYRAAADDLEHVALLTPEQLDAGAGDSRIGSFVLSVHALTPELFTVVVSDTLGANLLSTSIYARSHADTTTP